MRQIILLIGILFALCLSAGCAKTQEKTLLGEDVTVAVGLTETAGDTADSVSQMAADDPNRSLLKLDDGTVLDYQEPKLHTKILAVVPNEEKTNYVVVTSCQAAYGSSWTGLRFFDANGSYLHSLITSAYLEADHVKNAITFTGDLFRMNENSNVLYYNLKTRMSKEFPGRLLCSDAGVDLVELENSDKRNYSLIKDMEILDVAEFLIDDTNYRYESAFPNSEATFSLDYENKIAMFATKNIRYTLNFNAKTRNVERFYTESDLLRKIAASGDGMIEVYSACEGEAGDSYWCQVVTKDLKTGKYTFLTYLHNGYFCVPGADDILICSRITEFELFDINTGKKLDNFFDFAFQKNSKNIYLIGICYDKISSNMYLHTVMQMLKMTWIWKRRCRFWLQS